MLGSLEHIQPELLLRFDLGLRFALFTLAVLAVSGAVRDIYVLLKTRRNGWPINKYAFLTYYLNRIIIALAMIAAMPAALSRLGRTEVDKEFAFDLHLLSLCFLLVYFLTDELVRLLTNGATARQAIWRCVLIGVAAVILVLMGMQTDVPN